MRFMMMIKSDEQSEAGVLPGEELIAAMGRYNQEMLDAGVLLAGEGLHPSSKGAKVKFHGGKPTVTDGPFAEAREVVAGYWLIQASSLEEAVNWALRIPFEAAAATAPVDGEARVEIRRIYELEDFPVGEDESGWREAEAEHRASGAEAQTTPPGMKRFIVFRMADQETESETSPAPEEALLAAMGDYNQEMIRAGVMVTGEGLHPSSQGARVTYRNGKRTVTDGPFAEAKELIAGFSILQARDLAEVLEWVKRWPPLDAQGEVELQVRQIFSADDFGPEFTPELREAEERQRAQLAARK